MKTHLTRLISMVSAMAMVMFSGCEKASDPETPDNPDTPIPGTGMTFKIEETEISQSAISFKVTPSNDTEKYIALIARKDLLDKFADEDAIYQNDLKNFKDVAQKNEIPGKNTSCMYALLMKTASSYQM